MRRSKIAEFGFSARKLSVPAFPRKGRSVPGEDLCYGNVPHLSQQRLLLWRGVHLQPPQIPALRVPVSRTGTGTPCRTRGATTLTSSQRNTITSNLASKKATLTSLCQTGSWFLTAEFCVSQHKGLDPAKETLPLRFPKRTLAPRLSPALGKAPLGGL